VIYDTNHWKSFAAARMRVGMGGKGAMSLFGTKPDAHRLFARHVDAEYSVRTEAGGRRVDEWKLKPGGPDNHWFDGLIGCGVGASMLGCGLFKDKSKPPDQKPKPKRTTKKSTNYLQL